MAMDLNKVMIIGRATNNLQSKTIESTGSAVVNFTVATNRKFKNKEGNIVEDAEYHRCVAYGKGAEVLEKYLKKGKRIYIEGRLRTRKRQDSEGVDKYYTEIIVDSFIFLDSKGEGTSENGEDIIPDTAEDLLIEENPF
jgi:single-strand DNA-binding protein